MLRKFAAELVGTMVLVLFGCGAAVLDAELQRAGVDGGPQLRQFAQQGDELGPVAFDAQVQADAVEPLVLARRGRLAAGDAQAARGGEFAHALQGAVAGLAGVFLGGVDEFSQTGLQRALGLSEKLFIL